jgi:hypothetical protein
MSGGNSDAEAHLAKISIIAGKSEEALLEQVTTVVGSRAGPRSFANQDPLAGGLEPVIYFVLSFRLLVLLRCEQLSEGSAVDDFPIWLPSFLDINDIYRLLS